MARKKQQSIFEIENKDNSKGSNLAKYHVGGYLRLSKEDELSGMSASIENQEAIIRDYINSSPLEFTLSEIYIDDGVSASTIDRPSFLKLIEDCKSGLINCVIVKDTSRFVRNVADAEYYVNTVFPSLGIRFIALGSPIVDSVADPESVDGIAFHFENYFNEYFLKTTSKKIIKTFESKRKRGEFIGSFAPFGYMKDPENKHKLLIDEASAEIVRKVFHLFVNEGLSIGQVAIKLNSMGVPTKLQYSRSKGSKIAPGILPKIYAWEYVTVKRILQDERYCGHMIQGKKAKVSYKVNKFIAKPKEEWVKVPNTHKAIIDEEMFEKAQLMMVRPSRTTATGEKSKYSGILFCGKCGRVLNRKKSKKGSYSYVCKFHHETKMCEALHITETSLDERILYAIKTQISFITELEEIFKMVTKSDSFVNDSKVLKNSLDVFEKEKEKLEGRTHKLYDDYADGLIDRELYVSRSGKLKKDLEDVKDKLAKVKKEMRQFKEVKTTTNQYIENFKQYETIDEVYRDLLINLIDKIFVENLDKANTPMNKQVKKVRVVFNFADEAHALRMFLEENKLVAI